MNKHLFSLVFGLGAVAILWIGFGFIGTQVLALVMTALIGLVYLYGAFELYQFRQASVGLDAALAAIPANLDDLAEWLVLVPPALQNAVRLRVEGERVGLPGPTLTPYLVGLLVMLGMLGTFLGMVVTLNGAAFSLQGSTDLQTIRSALAAPIQGLGLAFGTSVAGVAASAMLGMMSALCRHQRLQTAQRLDSTMAQRLRVFSLTHQRQQAYLALARQAQALPDVAERMQAMMGQMACMSQQLGEQLLGNQEGFHREVKGHFEGLAHSVDRSLKTSLTQSAQRVGDTLTPILSRAMADMAQQASQMHQRTSDAVQTQITAMASQLSDAMQTLTASLDQRTAALLTSVNAAYADVLTQQTHADQQRQQAWAGALASSADKTLAEISRLMTCTEDLLRARIRAEAQWSEQAHAQLAQLTRLMRNEFGALRDAEAQRGQAAVARLGELQTALTHHLTTLGTALEDPINRLIDTASEAPRAAAEVIGQVRAQMNHAAQRDNDLLQERSRILETLHTLLASIEHASSEQRAVIDALADTSAVSLERASLAASTRLAREADQLAEVAAQVSSSAVEVASLGETFGYAVHAFQGANEKMISSLQRIEGALNQSMTRSDEQLAYYVAQAREVVTLSVLSQKEIFEALRQLSSSPTPAVQAVA